MIYSFMLATDPAITRVSKTIHQEAQSLVSQHGICRVNVLYDRTVTWGIPIAYFCDGEWHTSESRRSFRPQFSPTTLAMVQNLKVNVDMVEPYEANPDGPLGPSFPKIMNSLVGPMMTRKHCHLVFTLAKVYEICPAYEPQIASSFKYIQGFELVTIELRKRPWVRGKSEFWDYRKRIIVDDKYAVGVLREELSNCVVKKKGAGSRVKIIMGAAGESDGKVLWDSDGNGDGKST